MRQPGRKASIFVTADTDRVLQARGHNFSASLRAAVAGYEAMVAEGQGRLGKRRVNRLLRELGADWEVEAPITRDRLLYPLWGKTLYRELRLLSPVELFALYDLWLRSRNNGAP